MCLECALHQPVLSPGYRLAMPSLGSRNLDKPLRCSRRIPNHPCRGPPHPAGPGLPEDQLLFSRVSHHWNDPDEKRLRAIWGVHLIYRLRRVADVDGKFASRCGEMEHPDESVELCMRT